MSCPVDLVCAAVNQLPHSLDEGVAITQLVAYCLQLTVCGEGSKEEGSHLLGEDGMGYEWVDEPGFGTLSVHSILHLPAFSVMRELSFRVKRDIWCRHMIMSLICLGCMAGMELYTGGRYLV